MMSDFKMNKMIRILKINLLNFAIFNHSIEKYILKTDSF